MVRAMILVFFIQALYGFYQNIHLEKIFWFLLGLTVAVRTVSSLPNYARSDPIVMTTDSIEEEEHLAVGIGSAGPSS